MKKYAQSAGKDPRVQRDFDTIVYRLSLGYKDSGKTDTLFGNIRYTSRRSGARVYWREVNGTIEILAKCDKGSKLQKPLIKILKKLYK